MPDPLQSLLLCLKPFLLLLLEQLLHHLLGLFLLLQRHFLKSLDFNLLLLLVLIDEFLRLELLLLQSLLKIGLVLLFEAYLEALKHQLLLLACLRDHALLLLFEELVLLLQETLLIGCLLFPLLFELLPCLIDLSFHYLLFLLDLFGVRLLQSFFSLQLFFRLHFEFLLLPLELREKLLFLHLNQFLLLFFDLFFFDLVVVILSLHVLLHLFNDLMELSLFLLIFFSLFSKCILLPLQLRIDGLLHLLFFLRKSLTQPLLLALNCGFLLLLQLFDLIILLCFQSL